MKLAVIIFIIPFFLTSPIFAQPGIEWQKTIGGNADDNLTCIHQTSDGGYIVGGTSSSGISGLKSEPALGFWDYWVVKLDPGGNISWQKTIGGDGFDNLISIIETVDGYLVGGYSSSGIGGDKTEASIGDDFWIVKLSLLGAILWQNTISGDNSDHLESLQFTKDGGFILGGSSSSGIGYDKTAANCTSSNHQDFWLVIIDSLGNVLSDFTLGGDEYDFLISMHKTADEGYIIIGTSNSDPSCNMTDGTSDGINWNWILKINSLGSVEWDSVFTDPGGASDQYPGNIIQTNDGGFAFVSSGSADGYEYKLSPAGIIQWVLSSNDTPFVYVSQTVDGGYIIATEVYYGIKKLDSTGNVMWDDPFIGNNSDLLTSVAQTADKGFILGGSSASGIMNDKTENSFGLNDFWIIKTTGDTLLPTAAATITDPEIKFDVFPNPSSGNFTVETSAKGPATFEITDAVGQVVFFMEEKNIFYGFKKQINLEDQPAGIYFLKFQSSNLTVQQKLIKVQ